MPLHSRTIDEIFGRLLVRYGAAWIRMWEGLDMKPVKADWATQLERFSVADINYALDRLPEKYPPNVAEFRALCRAAPAPQVKRLPPPAFRADKAREFVENIKGVFKPKDDRFAWAKALRAREEAGEHLTEQVRKDWRAALERQLHTVVLGEFVPIDPTCLPPDMRLPQELQKNGDAS